MPDVNEDWYENIEEIEFENLVYTSGDTGDFIKLDEDKCKGCGRCELICPMDLWEVESSGIAKLSEDYKNSCLECAACWEICEMEAIQFKYPEGGTGVDIKYG